MSDGNLKKGRKLELERGGVVFSYILKASDSDCLLRSSYQSLGFHHIIPIFDPMNMSILSVIIQHVVITGLCIPLEKSGTELSRGYSFPLEPAEIQKESFKKDSFIF